MGIGAEALMIEKIIHYLMTWGCLKWNLVLWL
jgi:hypothetical protein